MTCYYKINFKTNQPRLKTLKKNHTLIHSNVSTAKVSIRWIATTVLSGNTDSIVISIARKLKSSEK